MCVSLILTARRSLLVSVRRQQCLKGRLRTHNKPDNLPVQADRRAKWQCQRCVAQHAITEQYKGNILASNNVPYRRSWSGTGELRPKSNNEAEDGGKMGVWVYTRVARYVHGET
jgi:hypothetical protein